MNIELFRQLLECLMQTHYGIDAGGLFEDDHMIAGYIKRGLRPYQIVNEHADECDLERTDVGHLLFGIPSNKRLTEQNERNAHSTINEMMGA